ncbi:MAG TPA: hypothetical protein VN766_11060 [Stellaceae bacterium]|jgi:hypothetical protein|nr:hypothetical protein [Stellaceae bacterium]
MDLFIALGAAIDRLDPDITAFLDHFSDGHMPLRLSLAIIGAALVLLAVLIAWGASAWLRIARLRRTLRALGTGGDFARNFRRIDAALQHSVFAASWRDYRECLKTAEARVLYARRPDEYLGLQAIPSWAFPTRFFAAAHGYFVGIGLLFTFIGLVAALKFAASGVTSTDVATAKEALNGLLSAASFKFMTSIAGLGCSLFLSVAARSVTYAIEGAAQGLCAELERNMAPLVSESLAYDQLAATREQSALLTKIGAGLGAVPAGAAVQAPAVDAAVAQDGLKQVLGDFLTEMRGTAGVEMKQLAGKLADVGTAIAQMQTHIGASGQVFADRMSLAANHLVGASATLGEDVEARVAKLGARIDALGESFARGEAVFAGAAEKASRGMMDSLKSAGDEAARGVGQATKALLLTADELARRLGGVIGGFDQVNGGIRDQAESMRDIVGSLEGAKRALDQSAESWMQSAAPIAASVEQSKQVASELRVVADRVGAAQRDMAEMGRAVAQLSEKASSVWDNYRSRFEKVDSELEAVFERLQGGTRAFGKEVMDFVGKLDRSLAEGMQALSVGTEELREVAEMLAGDTKRKAA